MLLVVLLALAGYAAYDYTNYKRLKERGAETRRRVDFVATALSVVIPDAPKVE
jgi:hypothetical protein